MTNETYLKLKELVETATLLEHSLLLEERINLVSYDHKGRIKSSHLYDYEDDSINHLEERLKDITLRQRQKWEPEFKRLTPSLTVLCWNIEFTNQGVILHHDAGASTLYPYGGTGLCAMTELLTDALLEKHAPDTTETTICCSTDPASGRSTTSCACHAHCGNSACVEGCQHCPSTEKPDQTEQETDETSQGTGTRHHCKSCNNCNDCNNDRCDKNPNIVRLLWDTLTEDQQKQFSFSLSPDIQEKLSAALMTQAER